MMSSSVTNMAWPMCSAPVTLGGGIDTTNGSPVAPSCALNIPSDSHLQHDSNPLHTPFSGGAGERFR
jgi:hypothetical protein